MARRGNGHPTLTETDGIAARAHAKWLARTRRGAEENDWLEAETELRQMGTLTGKMEHLQQRFLRLIGMQRRSEQLLAAEHGVSRVLAVSSTLADAAPRVLQIIGKSLDWALGALWTLDRHANRLRCVETWRAHDDLAGFEEVSRECTLEPGVGLPGDVWARDEPVWIPDVCQSANFARPHSAALAGLHTAVGFPIRDGSRLLGVIEFFSREVRPRDWELLETMASIGGQISQFTERREAERRIREEEVDRRVAASIQQGLLPRCMPSVAGFRFGGRTRPANVIGGDCFDFVPMQMGRQPCLGVLVADASGHGTAAALLMAETRAYIRALALSCTSLSSIVELTNRRLAADLESAFVTLFLACLDPDTRSLVYTSAGHWPAFVLDKHGRVRGKLESTGLPLGIDPEGLFPEATAIPLQSGDLLFMYTDGLVEALSKSGTMFGVARALETVTEHRHLPPELLLDRLFEAVAAFCGSGSPLDDITALVIKAE